MTLVSASVLETAVISVTATAQTLEQMGLTPAHLALADIAMITVEEDCRFVLGGVTDPTSSFGHYMVAQLDREFPGRSVINGMKLIRIGGSDIAGIVTLAKL